jgi:outer membrane immunogenic protein
MLQRRIALKRLWGLFMKKVLLASAALAALSTAALAADLPSRRLAPVAPVVPAFTWTGLYAGGQVGYSFGNDTPTAFGGGAPLVGGVFTASGSANQTGIIGGGHVGYLWSTQSLPVFGGLFGPAFGSGAVIGIEGDADGSSARSRYVLGGIPGTLFTGGERTPIQGSVRGRLGFTFDRFLVYATGGAAFGDLHTSYFLPAVPTFTSFSHTRVGYTVGGGVEYAVTNNATIRAEYRYTDFGSFSDGVVGAGGAVGVFSHHERDNRVQMGVSYKFDSLVPSPVVARY